MKCVFYYSGVDGEASTVEYLFMYNQLKLISQKHLSFMLMESVRERLKSAHHGQLYVILFSAYSV